LLVALTSPAVADGRAGDFDFYVLSLTWTPTYCATADNPDDAQCDSSHGFLVHGFWPEYETGYPEYCASSFPRGLKRSTLDAIAEIMPSASLAHYEWRKHGLCSGLAEGDYFGLMRDAAKTVAIPEISRKPAAASHCPRLQSRRRSPKRIRDSRPIAWRSVRRQPSHRGPHLLHQGARLSPMPRGE
jgi:ribonuclease I